MKIGFIGLGNVGGKLAASLLRNGLELTVRDLNPSVAEPLLADGATWAESPQTLTEAVDIVITCLPSPAGGQRSDGSERRHHCGVGSGQDLDGDEYYRRSGGQTSRGTGH